MKKKIVITGPSISPATACATSLSAIGDAYNLIKLGYTDMMIIGGVEEQLNYLVFQGTKKMKVLYQDKENQNNNLSCPFDKDRRGIILGEGSGALFIEDKQNAIKRKANIIAEIIGYGMSCDGYHMVQPDPNGQGGFRAMQQAIEFSGEKEEIKSNNLIVNCHATSTQIGDKAEIKALDKLHDYLNFEKDQKIQLTALKGNYGHTFSASGIIETIMGINMSKQNIIVPLCNFNETDIETNKVQFCIDVKNQQTKYLLKNSFGFGGVNNSLLIKVYQYNQLYFN